MVKVISLNDYRDATALRAGFGHWERKFGERFEARTGLAELSPLALSRLAEPGDESAALLYSLIIGFLGYAPSETFESLDSEIQSHVLEIYLFLSDQIRFEMMHRLGWLDRFEGNRFTLFEIVRNYERVKQACQDQLPQLAKDHPRWSEYRLLIDRDQQVFIRRMLTDALAAFKVAHDL